MSVFEQLAVADMFADGPLIDELMLDFDTALGRVAGDANDSEAFAAISYRFERAQATGELTQLYSMAMMVGAMACTHDHLQTFSNDLTGKFSEELSSIDALEHIGHQHDDGDEDDDPKSKKKKRSRWSH